MINMSSGFPTRTDINRAVKPQKMSTVLKFCISEKEIILMLNSAN